MSMKELGETFDLHAGGEDLIFPHHENEIAQTESITGKSFARYWVHNGMMQLGGEKMSKSLGNLVTIEDFLSKREGDVLRMMVLNSSYRNPITYSDEVLMQAERALERLRQALRLSASGTSEASAPEAEEKLRQQVEATRQGFTDSMDDDFNSAGALGYMFELVRVINQARDAGVAQEPISKAQDLLSELMGVFGLHLEKPKEESTQAAPFIDLLVQLRLELRQQKLWALADAVRNQLAELGVTLEDTRDGTSWRWQ